MFCWIHLTSFWSTSFGVSKASLSVGANSTTAPTYWSLLSIEVCPKTNMTVIVREIKIEMQIRIERITGNGRGLNILFPCDIILTNDPIKQLLILVSYSQKCSLLSNENKMMSWSLDSLHFFLISLSSELYWHWQLWGTINKISCYITRLCTKQNWSAFSNDVRQLLRLRKA